MGNEPVQEFEAASSEQLAIDENTLNLSNLQRPTLTWMIRAASHSRNRM